MTMDWWAGFSIGLWAALVGLCVAAGVLWWQFLHSVEGMQAMRNLHRTGEA